jgi:thiosulfate/3-mercaptopyruvate sulfurtransferase
MQTSLVSTNTLAQHLEDWVVLDCRHSLQDPEAGRKAYETGHIPGARFLHLDRDLSAPVTGKNGRHPLPSPEALALTLGRVGIGPGSQVVAYDDMGGAFAARLWWTLRWLGHDAVAVLDGGLQQWLAEGRALAAEIPVVQPRHFVPQVQPGWIVDANEVMAHLHDTVTLLLDARAADRYRGENETLDPAAGHIPGAVNRPFRDNLESSGLFKSATALRAEFEALLGGRVPRNVVSQCGSGVTACHNLLAMEYAGLSGGRLYPGSWSEWCADPSRPVATGSTP